MSIRVLLVQHQNHARRLFNHLLTGMDCDVTQCASLDDAADALRRGPVNLVFVDEPLPNARPGEAVRRLRASPVTANALLVALIDRTGERDMSQLVAAGVDEYMVLPAPLEDVQLRLRMLVGIARRIGAPVAEQQAAHPASDRFFESMPDPAFALDRIGTLIAANQRLADLTGYTIGQLLGQPAEFIGLPMAEEIPQLLEKFASSPGRMERITLVRRDMKPVSAVVRYAWLDPEERSIVVGVARETGEQDVQLDAPAPAVRTEPPAFEFDRRGVIRSVTPELAKLLGVSRERLIGQSLRDVLHLDDYDVIPRAIASGQGAAGTVAPIRLKHDSGKWVALEMSGHTRHDADGDDRFVLTSGVEAERSESGPQHIDLLTGLLDRHGFIRCAEAAVGTATRNQLVAMLFLNINHFKHINETYGYVAGDRMIVNVARRLESLLTGSDVLGRVGGDEFAILASGASSHAEALRFAERINHDLSTRPFSIEGSDTYLTASVGIAVGEVGVVAPAELLGQADSAAATAKRSGRGRIHIYEPRLARSKSDRLVLEQDLMQALRRNELLAFYQPEVDLRTGAIVGVEALVRWNHPQRGLIAPSRFIPSAENAGLLDPISQWVLEQATQQAAGWIARFGLRDFTVAVNFSADQFRTEQLISDISAALRRAALRPESFRAELTESVLVEDEPEIARRMSQLRKLGVNLAIDDFGTGYASFSYLRTLPVNQVKVDRTFVSGSGATSGELSLTRSMANVAREEGLDLIVEGIESASQLKRVIELGCSRGQGYYFSRPVGPETIEFLLMAGPYPFANLVNAYAELHGSSSGAAAS